MSPLEVFEIKIREIIQVFETMAQPESFTGGEKLNLTDPDSQKYHAALQALASEKTSDPLEFFRGIEFRPSLLTNTLLHFANLKPEFRDRILTVAAACLKEFKVYYGAKEFYLDEALSEAEQKRWMAFLIAYLPYAGMDLLDILVTLQSDSAFQESQYALRQIVEEGEPALRASSLFTEAEKAHFFHILDKKSWQAWKEFSDYLQKEYKLPALDIQPIPEG